MQHPSKSTWLIGEDIMKNGAAALRSMSDPKLKASLILGGTNWQTIDCGFRF
jgi:Zn-dependent metalloprotease